MESTEIKLELYIFNQKNTEYISQIFEVLIINPKIKIVMSEIWPPILNPHP